MTRRSRQAARRPKWRDKMKRQFWMLAGLFAAGASVGVAGIPVIYAQVVSSPTRQILGTDLQGVPGQEILFFTTDWAPGQKLPWHIHPDGHEFAYLIEGELTFEIEGIGKKIVKGGELGH